ncbi:alpha/beta hydrolase-fold protein [Curtobacterium sp. MCLR17_007]|uniref:alpha/beta hydrolase n=1 Tax=Curtobacterium sp. MCLR17_007 TaxID=2175648 RepID=UPI0021AC5DA2|nr:alpha/beta hydrolase-fold protein [Curtobacterium sp. MCLR17_007]WIB60609.1 alpha/beta hydrolase-fold protein [Curtobacterium sp. MCLR17_007]
MLDPFHWVMGTRLQVPTKLVPADVLFGVTAVVVLLPALRTGLRSSAAWRRTGVRAAVAVGGALLGLLACWVVGDLFNAFDVHLTDVTRMWVAMAFAGLALAVAGLVQGGRGRRVLAGVLVPLALLVPALGVNVDYAAYPTLNALVQTNPFPALDLGSESSVDAVADRPASEHWTPPATMPTAGRVGTVRIPRTRSGFPARPAVVYLPPAALTDDPPVLPVVVSLSGQPGSPSDMFTAGGIAGVLDAYAAAHHGLAPIVVSADQLAVPGHNTMCVDSSIGNAATYITQDVPAWVTAHLRVPTDRRGWGLVGFSQGATCATQFLSGYPDRFGAALAVSSELHPVDRSPQNSADEAFGGSLARWRAAAPSALMAANAPYQDTRLWLTAGSTDHEFTESAKRIGAAARRAGIHTAVASAPGSGHDWNTVQWSLANELPHEADALLGAPGVVQP